MSDPHRDSEVPAQSLEGFWQTVSRHAASQDAERNRRAVCTSLAVRLARDSAETLQLEKARADKSARGPAGPRRALPLVLRGLGGGGHGR